MTILDNEIFIIVPASLEFRIFVISSLVWILVTVAAFVAVNYQLETIKNELLLSIRSRLLKSQL